MDKGEDIDPQKESGDTALIYASERGHKETVNLLLDKGADIDHQNESGDTALLRAYKRDHKETVNLLLDSQEPEYFMEIQKLPPQVQEEIIRRLEEKAQLEGTTPLALASKAANLGLVELLIHQ